MIRKDKLAKYMMVYDDLVWFFEDKPNYALVTSFLIDAELYHSGEMFMATASYVSGRIMISPQSITKIYKDLEALHLILKKNIRLHTYIKLVARSFDMIESTYLEYLKEVEKNFLLAKYKERRLLSQRYIKDILKNL